MHELSQVYILKMTSVLCTSTMNKETNIIELFQTHGNKKFNQTTNIMHDSRTNDCRKEAKARKVNMYKNLN